MPSVLAPRRAVAGLLLAAAVVLPAQPRRPRGHRPRRPRPPGRPRSSLPAVRAGRPAQPGHPAGSGSGRPRHRRAGQRGRGHHGAGRPRAAAVDLGRAVLRRASPCRAKSAFASAVDVWARTIRSGVPIVVDARMEDLGDPRLLGATGPSDNFAGGGIGDQLLLPLGARRRAARPRPRPGASDVDSTFNASAEGAVLRHRRPGPARARPTSRPSCCTSSGTGSAWSAAWRSTPGTGRRHPRHPARSSTARSLRAAAPCRSDAAPRLRRPSPASCAAAYLGLVGAAGAGGVRRRVALALRPRRLRRRQQLQPPRRGTVPAGRPRLAHDTLPGSAGGGPRPGPARPAACSPTWAGRCRAVPPRARSSYRFTPVTPSASARHPHRPRRAGRRGSPPGAARPCGSPAGAASADRRHRGRAQRHRGRARRTRTFLAVYPAGSAAAAGLQRQHPRRRDHRRTGDRAAAAERRRHPLQLGAARSTCSPTSPATTRPTRAPSRYTGVAPFRLLDTRTDGGALGALGTRRRAGRRQRAPRRRARPWSSTSPPCRSRPTPS